MQLFRAVAYEVHTLKYMFSKKHPPRIDKFWPIGDKPVSKVSEQAREAFMKQYNQYLKKVNDG